LAEKQNQMIELHASSTRVWKTSMMALLICVILSGCAQRQAEPEDKLLHALKVKNGNLTDEFAK
jgi:hypothetical protein